jgi:hypothetical protein
MRFARPGFLLAGALCASFSACGGDSSPGTPISPPPVTVVARVTVTPDAASGFVGDDVLLAAHAFTAAGAEVTGRSITWASLDPSVASVANGTTAGTARITATVDAQSATATLVSNPPPLARVVLTPAAVLLGTGQLTTLTAVASDRSGAVMSGQAFTFTSTNPAVVTVSSTGTITPVAAGTASIIASASGAAGAFADTSRITVGGGAMLVVTLPDTVIAAGQTLRIGGSGLAGATATVGGVSVALANVTGASADLIVPASLFAPCLRAGVVYAVSIRVGADSVAGRLAAQAVPVQVSLAPGQHVLVQDGLDRGCPIATATGGTYVLMPYTWDQPYRTGSEPSYTGVRPSLPAMLAVATAPITVAQLSSVSRFPFAIPAGAIAHARVQASGSRGPLGAALLPSVASFAREVAPHTPPRSSTATTACGPAMTYGAVTQRATHRNAAGWADYRTNINTDPVEPWYVASVSNEIAILVDSTMWRKMAADTTVRGRLDQLTKRYDAEVAPLYSKYGGHPMWDKDGNQHVIVLMPYWGARIRLGVAEEVVYLGGASFYGCPSVSNEAIWMPSSSAAMLIDPTDPINANALPNVSLDLALLTHEATHAYDLGSGVSSTGMESVWAVEGVAELIRFLFTNHDSPTTFSANAAVATNPQFGADVVINNLCMYPDMSLNAGYTAIENLYNPRSDPRDYSVGCHIIRYAIEQASLNGVSTATAITRFLSATDRSTAAAVFNAVNATSRSSKDVMGDFLLSWAGDEVLGASAALQDRTWQMKSAFTSVSGASPFNIPESTISVGSARSFTLYEPSAHYYQVVSSTPVWVTYAAPDGSSLPLTRTALGILRTK